MLISIIKLTYNHILLETNCVALINKHSKNVQMLWRWTWLSVKNWFKNLHKSVCWWCSRLQRRSPQSIANSWFETHFFWPIHFLMDKKYDPTFLLLIKYSFSHKLQKLNGFWMAVLVNWLYSMISTKQEYRFLEETSLLVWWLLDVLK